MKSLESIEKVIVQRSEAPKQHLVIALWVVAIALGLCQAWANCFYMGNDGVSYLDMADAYLRLDWHAALNGSWNPLYAWLIGIDFLVLRPSPYWEFAAVQFLNFAIYVATVFSFEYFLRGWFQWRRGSEDDALRLVAYGLFLWATLILIGVWTTNADMLVCADILFAFGILVRELAKKDQRIRNPILLGMALAIGYYSKAVMFPFSVVLLLIAAVTLRWKRALTAAAVFAVLATPLIIGLSKTTGHLTIGDTGRVNFAWYVNGVAQRWWQGGPPRAGQPEHRPQIVLDTPRVYAFNDAFPKATYPIWYDFAYWYRGVHVWIERSQLERVMRADFKWLVKLIGSEGGGFLVALAVCVIVSRERTKILEGFAAMWPAWTACLAGILIYSMVHIETRYVGAFAVVIFLSAFTATHISGTRLAMGLGVTGLLWSIAFAHEPTSGARYLPSNAPENVSWQAAESLQRLGLHTDQKIASVCYSNRNNVFWARLARAHIVAEPDWNVDFWRLKEDDQQRVLSALARSGALFAVSDSAPPDLRQAVGWQQLGSTRFYAYQLVKAPALIRDRPNAN